MRIIADENIPHAREAFAPLGEVLTLPGRNLTAKDLRDCECLLVRSITPVNRALIADTPVRFVASATIGTDHIDLDYLQQQGIGFANAPGCNAEGAAEYIINVLFHLGETRNFDPLQLTAGIIGYGNVGSRVAHKLDALGIRYLINDPPLQESGDDRVDFVSLQTIIDECDFITCHVPLTRDGEHPTYHLLDGEHLAELESGTILFNAARGAVIDNRALSELLDQRDDIIVFLDTWEDEPAIDRTLMTQVDFGSPHIAGYSVEGKLRGTQMILAAACDYFNIQSDWRMLDHLPELQVIDLHNTTDRLWNVLFTSHFDVAQDFQRLLQTSELPDYERACAFDALRKHYPARYEYNHFRVENIADKKTASRIGRLLFRTAKRG